LKCKIFCWLAKRQCLPTNEQWFWHSLAGLAACPSCLQDEDVDHLLLRCPRACEAWSFFHLDLVAPDAARFTNLLLERYRSIADSTIHTAIAWNI
jgi:hypothetical protein